jgi:predicted component of type VI protein secretion system
MDNVKALEAAAKVIWDWVDLERPEHVHEATSQAITAYLSALAEDAATVERVKTAVLNAAILDMRVERLSEQQITVAPVLTNPSGVARAALAALKGEGK